MNGRVIFGLAFALLFSAFAAVHADEIRLKNGTRIMGTIVGYEGDSFKVKTNYGFALVRKDKIAEIIPSTVKKESGPEAKTKRTIPPLSLPSLATTKKIPPQGNSATPSHQATAAARPTMPGAPLPAAKASPQPAPVGPPPIRDAVHGNLYLNYTYGFQMYKPPDWDLIPEARKALPDAVAALGTSDETTMLVIGRQPANDSLAAHAAATQKALSEIYENYRPVSARQTMVAGLPAVERSFRGTIDGHDWSVRLLTVLRGHDAYTLLGMTWANSDLIQVEENVIARTMHSLAFTAPQP
jgi:hypothetical protein